MEALHPLTALAMAGTLSGCALFTAEDETSQVVRACGDMAVAQGGQHPALVRVAQQTGDEWRIEMWDEGNENRPRPDLTCEAVVEEDGHVEVESLR